MALSLPAESNGDTFAFRSLPDRVSGITLFAAAHIDERIADAIENERELMREVFAHALVEIEQRAARALDDATKKHTAEICELRAEVANLRVELRQALVNERRMASGDVIPLSQRRQSH